MTESCRRSRCADVRVLFALGVLSAGALAFEIALTRIFAIAQFYHFAFMIVSLALLGSGASGTVLALVPGWQRLPPARALTITGWGLALTTVGSYLLTLYLPFDSFRIALDARQGTILFLHYIALAMPFFFSGLAVGGLLAACPGYQNRIYAVNMAGSAVGCLLAMVVPTLVGGEGTILVVAAIGIGAALLAQASRGPQRGWARLLQSLALVGVLILAGVRPSALRIRLSPYKSLSYVMLYPDAELVWQRWNSFSRVDVVRSSSIRSLPGRGFLCPAGPPPQRGLMLDGDDLSPVSSVPPGFTGLPFTGCLMGALPYQLRPGAETLVLEPRGGFDVLLALSEGAGTVTAVENNPLVVEAVRREGAWAGNLVDDPRVRVVVEDARAYARRSGPVHTGAGERSGGQRRYALVVLALTSPQRAVVSGAYSLSEDYAYTVEAFGDYLTRLRDDGLLVVTRWLQVPPSESLRAFALAVEAIERTGGDPHASLVALRSYQQMLILARRGAFTEAELAQIRAFAAQNAFDLVYAPGIRSEEVNRYNVLPAPDYYTACLALLQAPDRAAWYRAYPFDVTPPTDDHPFFGHFFKWTQLGTLLELAGHTWQPFGGAGYLVLIVLLALAILASLLLVWGPFLLVRQRGHLRRARDRATDVDDPAIPSNSRAPQPEPGAPRAGPPPPSADLPTRDAGTSAPRAGRVLIYFALLGLGYLCVEIPMLQWFILFLGNPAWSMATVLFALLLFSGLGSLVSRRVPLRAVLLAIPLILALYVVGVPAVFRAALPAPLGVRVAVSIAMLAPPGVLMGMPFPGGIVTLCRKPALVSWAWASNGTFSVIASILAALLALSWGFRTVLAVGGVCYLGAWATVSASSARHRPAPSPRP